MAGSGRGYGVGGVYQTVLSLSVPLHTRRLFIKGMYECMYEYANACVCGVSLWFVFFLYRWFYPLVCVPGSVSFLCRDGLVMHWEVTSSQTSSSLQWFSAPRSVPFWLPYISRHICLCLCHRRPTLTHLSSSLLSPKSPPCLLRSPPSVSLFSFSLSVPVSPSPQAFPVLAHQCWQPPWKQCHNHNEHVEFS